MLDDEDKRVVPSVLDGLARLKAPGIEPLLLAQLKTVGRRRPRAPRRAPSASCKPAGGAGGAARGVCARRRRTRPTTCATPR